MRIIHFKFMLLIVSSLLLGCATVPKKQIWRPWTRTIESDTPIYANRSICIKISGQTGPLLGNEDLTKIKISENARILLERRGFKLTDEEPDYAILITYKTVRHDKTSSFSSSLSSSSSFAGAKSGLGVSIAQAVGLSVTNSSFTSTQSTIEVLAYNHTISVEIYNPDDILLWIGESTWDTDDLDLTSDILPALQTIFSYLPADPTHLPIVDAVKSTHTSNYYNLVCRKRKFSCPALPYRLSLDGFQQTGITSSIKDRYAFAAYVDLLQTAEYALPIGSKNWKDPLNISLWNKVELSGQYLLEPEQKPINVIMTFSGRTDGYYIDKCWVASDIEYAEFQDKMNTWRKVLEDYYDVYEK